MIPISDTGMSLRGVCHPDRRLYQRTVLVPDLSDVLDDMRWKAKNILLTDFDVRGHRTLERTLNDRSVPFLINGTDAGEAHEASLAGRKVDLLSPNIQVNARFTFPPCRKDMQPGNGIYQISRKQDRVSWRKTAKSFHMYRL